MLELFSPVLPHVPPHALPHVLGLSGETPEPEEVKAGWTALVIFLLLILAVVVLAFSLTKQLRKAQAAKDAGVYGDRPGAAEDPADGTPGPAGGTASEDHGTASEDHGTASEDHGTASEDHGTDGTAGEDDLRR